VVVGRLFIAVPLPDEVRHALAALLDGPLPGRAVHPSNWHLTLRFLGDTDEVTYDRLLHALGVVDFGEPFRAAFGALGAFPRPAKATVLWVGFSDGLAGFTRLSGVVAEAVEAAGIPSEDRPFRAHLTLSRIRPHQDVRPVIDRPPFDDVSWTVGEVDVFRSHLGSGGPRYERLERIMLGVEHMFE
jgi:2'-5' RNA ligase